MSGAMAGGKMLAWRRVFRIPPHGMPRPRSFFGRQGRGVWHTPHKAPSHGWRMPVHDQRQGPRPPSEGRLWVVCNTPLPRGIKTHHIFHLPPHSMPQRQPIFQVTRQNMPRPQSFFGHQGRGVWHTPHKMAPQGTRMRIDNRSFGSFAP